MKQAVEIRSAEEVQVLDEAELDQTRGGVVNASALVLRDRFNPVQSLKLSPAAWVFRPTLRPIDLVMGKTTLF